MAGDYTRSLWPVTTHGVYGRCLHTVTTHNVCGRWHHTVSMAGDYTQCL